MSKTPKNTAVIVQRRPQNPIESVAKKNNNATKRKPDDASQVSKTRKLSGANVAAGKPQKRGVLKNSLVEQMEALKEQVSLRAIAADREAKNSKEQVARSSLTAMTTISWVKNTSSQKEQNAVLKNDIANSGTLETRKKIKNGVATKRVLQPIQEDDGQHVASPIKAKAKAKTRTTNAVNGSAKKVRRVLKKKVKVDIKE